MASKNGKTPAPTKSPSHRMPAIAFTHDDASDPDAATAVAALTVAREQLAATDDKPTSTPPTPSPDVSPATSSLLGSPSGAEPPRAVDGARDASTERDRSPADGAPKKTDKPGEPKLERLTAKKYAGVKADVLRVMLVDRDNEVTQLRARLAIAPAQAAESGKMLELACGETLGVFANLSSLKWGDDCKLTAPQRTRLGQLWAPVIAPYLNNTAHAALIQAIMGTADVIVDKVVTVKTRTAAET